MALSILLETFLVSNLSVSAKMGVNGIALTNIAVNALILVVTVLFLKRENIAVFSKEKWDFRWLKEWFKVGKFLGLESLLRNLVLIYYGCANGESGCRTGQFLDCE